MKIAIIGTGNVGSALARSWAAAGRNILLGARDAAKVDALASEIGAQVVQPKDTGKAEVIVLAVPWSAAQSVLAELGDLTGKIILDCTNPLGRVGGRMGLLLGHDTSGAEVLAQAAPGARVVKTLNQTGAEIMAAAKQFAKKPAMFMAGDDADAKTTVGSLVRDIGFDAMDAGDLTKARLLEPFALVWINQAILQGKGRTWALIAQDAPDV